MDADEEVRQYPKNELVVYAIASYLKIITADEMLSNLLTSQGGMAGAPPVALATTTEKLLAFLFLPTRARSSEQTHPFAKQLLERARGAGLSLSVFIERSV